MEGIEDSRMSVPSNLLTEVSPEMSLILRSCFNFELNIFLQRK